MKELLVCFALFLLLLGCASNGVQKNEPALAKTPYTNEKYGFTLYPPEGWKVEVDSSGNEVDFSLETTTFLVKARDNPGAGSASYSDYCDNARSVMSAQQNILGGAAPNFSGEEPVYVSDIKACKVSAVLPVMGHDIDTSYIVFGKGDVAYYIQTQISSGASEEDKNYYEKSFNMSIASLRLN